MHSGEVGDRAVAAGGKIGSGMCAIRRGYAGERAGVEGARRPREGFVEGWVGAAVKRRLCGGEMRLGLVGWLLIHDGGDFSSDLW